MTPLEKWLVWLSTSAVAVSGAVYGAMKYLMTSEDPYAVIHHPLQPFFLKAHVLCAPVLVFAVGMVYTRHVIRQWKSGRPFGRTSGIGIVATLVPMIFSGYALQTLTSDRWMYRVAMLHVLMSAVYLAGLVVHAIGSWRRERLREALGAIDSDST